MTIPVNDLKRAVRVWASKGPGRHALVTRGPETEPHYVVMLAVDHVSISRGHMRTEEIAEETPVAIVERLATALMMAVV